MKLSDTQIGFIIHALQKKSERLEAWGKSAAAPTIALAMTVGEIWKARKAGEDEGILTINHTDWAIILNAVRETAHYYPWWRFEAEKVTEIIEGFTRGKKRE